jgi:hypothetical protein
VAFPTSDWPNSIDANESRTDGVDVVDAADFNFQDDQIVKLQTRLGAIDTGSPLVPVTTFAELQAVVTAIGSGQGRVLVSEDITVGADYEIPAGIALRPLPGVTITVSATFTLTLTGPLVADPLALFAGAGDVTFSAGSTPVIYPEWFGAEVGGTASTNAQPSRRP